MLFVGVAYAQAPIQAIVARLTKPKPITESSEILSVKVQQAIEYQAKEELKQEQAAALVATNTSGGLSEEQSVNNNSTIISQSKLTLLQDIIDPIQLAFTTNPVDKAKLRLSLIDRKIQKLVLLLQNDKSDNAVAQAVVLIKEIGAETDKIAKDPSVQGDRDVLTQQIQQYNRLQLKIQKIEESLPLKNYLKIEQARQQYLVVTAVNSINGAPNLEAVHNIGVKEVEKMVGADFAELKAIEIVSDFKSGVRPEAQQKLTGLQKELALEFEKRMLPFPLEVRMRKLENFIQLSYGNPLLQVESFDTMKQFLTDREMILGVETLKELALKKLEDRIFEIDSPELREQFVKTTFKSPQDLEVLEQVHIHIAAGTDEKKKQQIAALEKSSYAKLIETFGTTTDLKQYYASEVKETSNILDVAVTNELADTLEKSSTTPVAVKKEFKIIQQKILQNFVTGIKAKTFQTQPKLSYNPVSENADVRLLLPVPRALLMLEEIKSQVNANDKAAITLAEKANVTLLTDHVLRQINDPVLFEEYQKRIENNPEVKKLIEQYVGQTFFTNLDNKEKVLALQEEKDKQALYEKMQQIIQQIFLTADDTIALEEQGLPQNVVDEIQAVKAALPDREIPQLTVPEGVTLPDIATLPDEVEQAIILAAKNKINAETQSEDVKLDLSLEAKDLGIGEPTILPDNPLYPIKEVIRSIDVVITLDPIERAEKVIEQANEKTLEVAKLIEEDQSQQTIDLSLEVLQEVSTTFDKLQEHTDALVALQTTEAEKMDQLVDQIIVNGLARQTILSAIEDKVSGSDYVQVEQIRQDVLKDGIDTLLTLTNNDTQTLVDKLQTAVEQQQGSEFKEIKAVELLIEIARTQPVEVQKILDTAQEQLAATLEDKLLAIPAEERRQELLDYAQSLPGNPVRQFETYEKLKDGFDNPDTILLTEALKDKSVENLTDLISEIIDANARQEFVDQVIGNRPEDLRIIIEIQLRVDTPETAFGAESTPIEQKIADIKAAVEQNLIDTYQDNPEALSQTELFSDTAHLQTPDIIDIKVTKELVDILERTPEVQSEVIQVAQALETKITDQFIENVSSPNFATTTVASINESNQNQTQTLTEITSTSSSISLDAVQVLEPIPAVIEELTALKSDVPPNVDVKIDAAIAVQVDLIQEHLVTQVTDPQTFQTYVAQITENPTIAEVIAEASGEEFTKAIREKTQEIQIVAVQEQTTLEITVASVQQEIFNAPLHSPSSVEQTLSQPVQEQIQEIKQEIPQEQIPQVTVAVQVEVAAPVAPAPVEQPSAPAPIQEAAPAPVIESAPAPQTESAPPPAEAPAAPAVEAPAL